MGRNPRRRAIKHQREQTMVVLCQVLVTVAETGILTVTVDGAPYPPPEGRAWTRADFGNLLDAITRDRSTPVRVEVHESDGTVFTDLVRPQTPVTSPAPELVPAVGRGRHAKDQLRPTPIEVTADGFVPGEDIVVTVILTRTRATTDGTVHVPVDISQARALAADGVAEVVLHGPGSGTTRFRRLL